MAENQEQENISLNFKNNVKEVTKDVNNLNASIDATTTSTSENNKEVEEGSKVYTNFKTQLRQANQELLKTSQIYGETSKEAVEAAKKVADLKDQMQFSKDLVDKFNPDQKFKALGAATQVAGTGLQGVTSGMALFGDQSKDTQAQLLKVQAAMAFSDAISNLSNIGDQFRVLKTTLSATWTTLTTAKVADTVATEVNTVAEVENAVAETALTTAKGADTVATIALTIATNLWTASVAIALAPITLIIAGIAALVLGIGYLTGAFGDFSGDALRAEVANKKLNQSIDRLDKATEKSNATLKEHRDTTISMARASGKSSEEIRKLEEALINQEVAEKRLNAVKAQSIFIEARRVAGLEDATDAQKETSKKAYEEFKKQNETFSSAMAERRQMAIDHRIAIRQEETDAKKKELEEQKSHNEDLRKEATDNAKKLKEARIKEAEDLEKERQEHIRKTAENAMQEYDDTVKMIAEAKKKNEDNLLSDRELAIKNEEENYSKKLELAKKGGLDTEALEIEHLNNLNEIKLKSQEDTAKKELETETALSEAKKSLKESEYNALSSGIGLMKDLFGKNKAIQKGLVIAEGVVNVSKIIGSTSAADAAITLANAPLGPAGAAITASQIAMNHVNAGIGIATTIAATSKALSALGGGSAGSATTMAGKSGGSSATPQVAFKNSSENQIAQGVANVSKDSPTMKVYVTESDITKAQENVKTIVDKNKF